VICELPASAFHAVTKKVISSKEVKLLGVNWDAIRIVYCTKCAKATQDLTVMFTKRKWHL
jgi:hypothetical protein